MSDDPPTMPPGGPPPEAFKPYKDQLDRLIDDWAKRHNIYADDFPPMKRDDQPTESRIQGGQAEEKQIDGS